MLVVIYHTETFLSVHIISKVYSSFCRREWRGGGWHLFDIRETNNIRGIIHLHIHIVIFMITNIFKWRSFFRKQKDFRKEHGEGFMVIADYDLKVCFELSTYLSSLSSSTLENSQHLQPLQFIHNGLS